MIKFSASYEFIKFLIFIISILCIINFNTIYHNDFHHKHNEKYSYFYEKWKLDKFR